VFLKEVSGKILSTGKNVNVLNEMNLNYPYYKKLIYSSNLSDYFKFFSEAEMKSNEKLIEILMKKEKLIPFLSYIKSFFFLEGDFCVQFLDLSESELYKEVSSLDVERLRIFLEMSLEPEDVLKSHLTCEFDQQNKRKSIIGFQAFQFSLNVNWPISLILNHKTIQKYQNISKHLFNCKFVERNLNSWSSFDNSKNFTGIAQPLRHQMLIFLYQYQFFVKFEMIDKFFDSFLSKVKKASSLDEILIFQNEFFYHCGWNENQHIVLIVF
jgi:gamma-tubulin complex component 2